MSILVIAEHDNAIAQVRHAQRSCGRAEDRRPDAHPGCGQQLQRGSTGCRADRRRGEGASGGLDSVRASIWPRASPRWSSPSRKATVTFWRRRRPPVRTSCRAWRRCWTSRRSRTSLRWSRRTPSCGRSMRAMRSPRYNRATDQGHHGAFHGFRRGQGRRRFRVASRRCPRPPIPVCRGSSARNSPSPRAPS